MTNTSQQLCDELQSRLSKSTNVTTQPLLTVAPRWSTYAPPEPACVVLATEENDVATAIKYCHEQRIPFVTSNRGNGWYADTTLNQQGIVIDISRLDKVTFHNDQVDEKHSTIPITIQGGVRTSDFRAAAANNTPPVRVAQPTCNCLGWLGAALGGGLAKSAGRDGLLSDSINSLRVALATGEIVTATAHNKHSDLFWAMKGAGPNFGVVLSAELTGHLAVVKNRTTAVWQGSIIYSPDQLEDLIQAVENTPLNAGEGDLQIDITFANTPDFKPVIQVIPSYYLWDGVSSLDQNDPTNKESLAKTEAACQRFLKLGPLNTSWELLPYDKWNVESDDLCSLAGMRAPVYTVNEHSLRPDTYRRVFDHFSSFLAAHGGKEVSLLFLQPQIYPTQRTVEIAAEKGEDGAGAFPWRQTKIFTPFAALYTDPSFDAQAAAWGEKAREILQDGAGAYVNFAHGDESLETVYGSSLKRLQELKAKYDPANAFSQWFPLKK